MASREAILSGKKAAAGVRAMRRLRLRPVRGLMYVVLLTGVVVSIIPFVWTALTSFKTFGEHINRETWPAAWTSEPYQGVPQGGTLQLPFEPATNWEGAPRSFSPLMEAKHTLNGPEDLSPIIAEQLAAESEKLLRRAADAQARADDRLAEAAALPADQSEEIARLQEEAADLAAEAEAFREESQIYPLDVLFLAADSTNDNTVNYDTFVLTVDARVKQQETVVIGLGEWSGPYYKYASVMERWGPHFSVREATPTSLTVEKSWRVSNMLLFNYLVAWDEADFSLYLRNSVVITLTTATGILVFSVLAAYAFARMEFPGRDLLFNLYLATMMIPGVVLLIPNFLIVRTLNDLFADWLGLPNLWFDNLPPLVVPFLASAFSIFLLRQFFAQIPKELYDAALIDGCGHLRFLTRIVLPLSKAPLMSVAILSAIQSWNSFLWPILVTTKPDWRPITVGLSRFIDEAGAQMHLMMAGAVIAIVPILILYFFTQKQFTEGIATTGLKG